MEEELQRDVAVVGAGLAGVAAARQLEQHGLTVALIEARDEVGGRTRSRVTGGRVVELGGTFFSLRQWRLTSLIRALGLSVRPSGLFTARKLWRTPYGETAGRLPPIRPRDLAALADVALTARRLARELDPDAPWRSRSAEELDRLSVADWLDRRGIGGRARWLISTLIGGFAGRPIERVALLEYLWWLARYDGRQLRALRSGLGFYVAEGAQELSLRLSRRLQEPPLLGKPIERIEQDGDEVALNSGGRVVCRARKAIVTAPLATLGGIAFDPPLDDEQAELCRALRPGHLTKIGATALAGVELDHQAVLGDESLPYVLRLDGHLVAYGLEDSRGRPPEELLAALASGFGLGVRDVEGEIVDWSDEPYARGAYVAFAPGQITRHGPHLRRSHGLVHFAGAERSSMPQQMEGALESAARAADEIVHSGG